MKYKKFLHPLDLPLIVKIMEILKLFSFIGANLANKFSLLALKLRQQLNQ